MTYPHKDKAAKKLTVAQVKEIREEYGKWFKEHGPVLAEKYKVGVGAIRKVIERYSFPWI